MAPFADGCGAAAAADGWPSPSSRVASPVSSDSGCLVLACACSGLSGCLSGSRKLPEALDADALRLQDSEIGLLAIIATDTYDLITSACGHMCMYAQQTHLSTLLLTAAWAPFPAGFMCSSPGGSPAAWFADLLPDA
jgi:hypothetical protein